MRIVEVRKRSGGVRVIYAPSREERREYRELLSTISQPPGALRHAHGFMTGRNIITNAVPHVDKVMTISMDLSDFFDSVRPSMVRGRVPGPVIERCFLRADGTPGTSEDCRARQGLPTSPALANLAMAPVDDAIARRLGKLGIPGAVYTRYADDLSISCDTDEQATAALIIAEVSQIVSRSGFRVNPKKTRVKRAAGGNRECCGVMASPAGVVISRRMRRVLRAARHNYSMGVAHRVPDAELRVLEAKERGLTEFAKCKTPKVLTDQQRTDQKNMADACRIASTLSLKLPRKVGKVIEARSLGQSCYITNDPAMVYGMSAYTTGWTSCMAILGRHGHNYYKGVPFWHEFPGVSLAYLDSGQTMSIAGVTRPKMSARALIYLLRDGRTCHGDIYSGGNHSVNPSTEPGQRLMWALRGAGIISADECRGTLVAGNLVYKGTLPYFDNTYPETIKLAESQRQAYRLRID